MNLAEWIARVVVIAESRGIQIYQITYPRPGEAVIYGRDPAGPWHVQAGCGEYLIPLTTPEQFTALWWIPEYHQPQTLIPPGMPDPGPAPVYGLTGGMDWDRRGRHVPRIPARAVAMALEQLT
jgi:hypothetical protein